MQVVSDPEVDSRPIPRHTRGDPDGHVPVYVIVNRRRLSTVSTHCALRVSAMKQFYQALVSLNTCGCHMTEKYDHIQPSSLTTCFLTAPRLMLYTSRVGFIAQKRQAMSLQACVAAQCIIKLRRVRHVRVRHLIDDPHGGHRASMESATSISLPLLVFANTLWCSRPLFFHRHELQSVGAPEVRDRTGKRMASLSRDWGFCVEAFPSRPQVAR